MNASSCRGAPPRLNAFALAALLLAGVPAVHAQPLAPALEPFVFPFAAADTTSSALSPLLDAVRDARIVGLGEPTHGTAEVFQLKHRLIRQLVEDGRVRHLVLEASVGEGADFDDYVSGRRDDLDVLLGNLPLWMFQNSEFADLLRWLRAYNTTAEQPVRVYGMEAQYADRSARHALAYLRALDAPLAQQLLDRFGAQRVASDTASAPVFAHLYAPLPDSTLTAYQSLFLGLRSAMDSRHEELVATSSPQAFDAARRHVGALGQFTSLALLESEAARAQLRDYIMAVNVAGIVESANANDRVVVWAHNEHVWKREGNGGYDVLGRQLARWYGLGYYAIGFDFGSGAYRAPGATSWVHDVGAPASGSFTATLAGAGRPDALLDIRAALGTPAAAEALRGPLTVRATAGGQVPMRNGVRIFDQSLTLSDRFDGWIFVSKSTPTTLLRR
jgi:erythromycin esterase